MNPLVANEEDKERYNMKQLYIFIIILLTYSCSAGHENNGKKVEGKTIEASTPYYNVALKFINDYTDYCNNLTGANLDSNWIYRNQLLTQSFKDRYKTLLDSAYKKEPELGLDFDPIFDAQDYPDKGFVILKSDNNTGFVTVKGKNWKEFTVILKVVSQNGKWLVDGAGIINIPTDKQVKR
jgi:hypothetical protein